MVQSGQIILFRFPQADFSAGKLRPALLIAEAPGRYSSWLVCMISSQLHQHIEGFDEIVSDNDLDFTGSGLKQTSVIRASRLAVIELDMLEGSIGSISSKRLKRLKKNLARWITDKA